MRFFKGLKKEKVKYIFIFIVVLISSLNNQAISQSDSTNTARNAVYLEAGGLATYGSINYERLLPLKNKWNLALRIGFGSYRLKDFNDQFNPDLIIPIAIYGLYGKQHKVEFGFGQAITNIVRANPSNFQVERESKLSANFTIGYRYQNVAGGLFIRIAYSPIIEFYKNYRHWGGVSVGYGF